MKCSAMVVGVSWSHSRKRRRLVMVRWVKVNEIEDLLTDSTPNMCMGNDRKVKMIWLSRCDSAEISKAWLWTRQR